jgi:hypothetical protein
MVLGVDDDSPLRGRVSAGSVLTSIAGKPIASLADLLDVASGDLPADITVRTTEPTTPVVSAAGERR